MRIGLGVTALRRSQNAGSRDGISSYSAALRSEMHRLFPNHSFVDATFCTASNSPRNLLRRYEVSALTSAVVRAKYSSETLFSESYDLFHAMDHFIPKMRIPVVATIHDVGPLSHPHLWPQNFRYWKNLLFAAKCRFPARIVAVSQFTADEVSRCVGVSRNEIEVIYEGVGDYVIKESQNELDWRSLHERYSLKPGYVVYCGSLAKKKNIAALIRAHEAMPLVMRRRHPLVLIGGVPAKERVPGVLAAIERGQIDGCVKWLGTLLDEESAKIVHHSDLLAFPSLHEGFGLPVVEAFQLGIPVITSNVGALPEISGGAAVLINPLDIGELSRTLQKLLEDNVWRGELAARGRERATDFRWEKCAKLTFEVYERALS